MVVKRVASGPLNFLKQRVSQARSEFNEKQRTYIVPTYFGLAFGLLSFLLLLIALSYANNLLYLLVFFLISVALNSMVQTNKNIDNLYLLDIEAKDVFALQCGQLILNIGNKGNVESENVHLYIKGEKSYICYFSAKESKQVTIDWSPKKRGYNEVPSVYIASTYPFGLLRAWKRIELSKKILIYPQPLDFKEIVLTNKIFDEDQDKTGYFRDMREYQRGDNPKRIHWLSSLKQQKLLIKNFDELNNDETLCFDIDDLSMINSIEDKISQLTYWVKFAEQNSRNYILKLGEQIELSGRGHFHYQHCLSELATYGLDNENI